MWRDEKPNTANNNNNNNNNNPTNNDNTEDAKKYVNAPSGLFPTPIK